MNFKNKKNIYIILIIIVLILGYFFYTNFFTMNNHGKKDTGPMLVNVLELKPQDVPMTYEFTGNITSTDQVKIIPKVSGAILERYVEGGQEVTKGQPLFKIDPSMYETQYLAAKAQVEQASANYQQAIARLENAKLENDRYQKLLKANAISQQMADNSQSQVNALSAAAAAQQAMVSSNIAMMNKAKISLNDTIIRAPISGKLALDMADTGTFVNAGNTVVASMGNTKEVYAKFNVSEGEYIDIKNLLDTKKDNITLVLSDGKTYPIKGSIAQVNSVIKDNTGTIAINALFKNPNDLLIPGMFAKINIKGDILHNTILVPQRAVQQLLEKSFVMVVDEDGKSQTKEVVLGSQIGSYYIVKSGLSAGDKVIVEGLTKLQPGMPLNVQMKTANELGLKL